MDWLSQIVFWHWWVLAGLLLIVEMSTPSYFFLWLGIAAAAVGFLVLVFPGLAVGIQFVAFGVLSIIAALGWRRHNDENP